MMSLLETMIVFVGVILILALATQSLLEVVKVAFPVKSFTRLQLLNGLLSQAAVAAGLSSQDGKDVSAQIATRLRAMGLKGLRRKSVRLDQLDADQVVNLVKMIDRSRIPNLRPVADDAPGAAELEQRFKDLADRVRELYPLAMGGVDARNGRRMRFLSLFSSLIVVFSLNVDALTLWTRIRADDAARTALAAGFTELHAKIDKLEPAEEDAAAAAAAKATRAQVDETFETLRGQGILASPSERNTDDPSWWLGILLMAFLVGLGMPFWHETLGSLLGVRKRIQAGVSPEKKTTDKQADQV